MKAYTVPTIFTAVDRFSNIVDGMGGKLSEFGSKAQRVGRGAKSFAVATGAGALAILAPLGVAANEAIKFQDRLADISKTTGLTGPDLEKFGDQMLKTSRKTRSSVEDLLTIGEIGGQLGVAAQDLGKFTEAANIFNVALGQDYGGVENAITQVGKIKNLFKETRTLDIADVITKSGSAINQLGAIGSGTSANINDFILRMGALPDAVKPSFQATAALGTFFEEMGIDAQIGASGMSNFLLTAGKRIDKFASQMGIGTVAAKELFQTDPTKFATRFAKSFKGMAPDVLAKKLHALGLNSLETQKVVGALGSGIERLAELQNAASTAFSEGTSLLYEYDTKNSTVAAKIGIAKNNLQVFAITVGTKLLPVLGELIDRITPVIDAVMNWMDANPGAVEGMVKWGVAIGGILGVLSALGTVISVVSAAIAMTPVGWIIIGITALIALIAAIVINWKKWGAAVSVLLGPLGTLISFVMELVDNWDMVTKAFKDGGILGALKAIGKIFVSAILHPIEQLLSIVGKLSGWEWASNAAAGLRDFRAGLGVHTDDEKDDSSKGEKPVIPPPGPNANLDAQVKQKQLMHQLGITIYDPGKHVKDITQNGPLNIPVVVGPTWGK